MHQQTAICPREPFVVHYSHTQPSPPIAVIIPQAMSIHNPRLTDDYLTPCTIFLAPAQALTFLTPTQRPLFFCTVQQPPKMGAGGGHVAWGCKEAVGGHGPGVLPLKCMWEISRKRPNPKPVGGVYHGTLGLGSWREELYQAPNPSTMARGSTMRSHDPRGLANNGCKQLCTRALFMENQRNVAIMRNRCTALALHVHDRGRTEAVCAARESPLLGIVASDLQF